MPLRQLTQGWFKRLSRALLGSCILLIGLASAVATWDFGEILQKAESRYGSLGPAKQRIQAWEAQIKASAASSEIDKLTEINRFFNRQVRFSDDIQIWRQNDYWATPIETLVKGAGDCEDYSIAKYFTLRRLGIPSSKLRITYVKALNYNQAHMVLTYTPAPMQSHWS